MMFSNLTGRSIFEIKIVKNSLRKKKQSNFIIENLFNRKQNQKLSVNQ